jgi:serine/threonine protein kinase
VLQGKAYNKSVDIFLFGLLVYELLCGVPAFPFRDNLEEHEHRITECIFAFPGEEGCDVQEPPLSEEAKSLIKSLVCKEPKDRLSISKIKASPFFKKYISEWTEVEQGFLIKDLRLNVRDPANTYDFDEVSFHSDDVDFEHEYAEQDPFDVGLGQNENSFDLDQEPAKEVPPRETVLSDYYNKDRDEAHDQIVQEMDFEAEFSVAKSKVAGFSFVANDEKSKIEINRQKSGNITGSYDVGFLRPKTFGLR